MEELNAIFECATFAVIHGLSVVIGLYYGCVEGKQNTVSDYLLGGKHMSVFPIIMTLITGNFHVGSTVQRPQVFRRPLRVFQSPPVRGISDYNEMFYKRLCAEEIGRKFEVSHDQLKDIEGRMTAAIEKGLGKTEGSMASVRCWDAHVDYPVPAVSAACASVMPKPRVSEFLSLDVSHGKRIGTQFTTISPRDEVAIKYSECDLWCLRTGGGRQVFDRAAEQMARFVGENHVNTAGMPLAFTFGFPMRHTSLGQAVLHRWTKEFNSCAELTCANVVDELRSSLAHVGVRVGQMAVFNDLTSDLLDTQINQPDARICIKVDDGCNCCFVERVANVRGRQIVGKDAAAMNTIVNTEWGAFGENGELHHLRTPLDRNLDAQSLQPGQQIFEKMTSGMYMGELVRQFVVAMARDSIVFQGLVTPAMNTKYVLKTEHLIRIESDPRRTYVGGRDVLASALGIYHPTDMDCALLRYASECITKRSAHLIAAAAASVVQRLQSRDPACKVHIVANGSMFCQCSMYELMMMCKLKSLIPYTGSLLPKACSTMGSIRVAQLLAKVPETC